MLYPVITILCGLICANLCWLPHTWFGIVPLSKPKSIWLFLLEYKLGFAVFVAMGIGLEYRQNGVVSPQDWEFLTVLLLLFMVASVPGFVWQRLLKTSVFKT